MSGIHQYGNDGDQIYPKIRKSMDELENVNITGLADDEILVYDSGSGLWVNEAQGSGGYPFDTKELTVDPTDPDAEYTTVAAAAAAASAGDCIRVGAGTHTVDGLDVPANVDLRGSGAGITILKTTTNIECINLQGGNQVSDLSVENTYQSASTTFAIRVEGAAVTFHHVSARCVNNSGSGRAWRLLSGICYMYACEGESTGSGGGSIALLTSGGSVDCVLLGGRYRGLTNDLNAGTAGDIITLVSQPLLVEGVIVATGTVQGFWTDVSGNAVCANAVDIGTTTDSDAVGDIYLANGQDIFEGVNTRSGAVGPFFAERNRWSKALGGSTLLSHMSSIPSGHSWAGAPFDGTPTVSYLQSSYMKAGTADLDGAFLYDAPTGTLTGKFIAIRAALLYASEVGIRLDDGTDDNVVEFYITDGSYYIDFETRYQTGGGGFTTASFGVRGPIENYYHIMLEAAEDGANWKARCRTMNEVGTTVFHTTIVTGLTWTISRAGIILRPLIASERSAYIDWLASTFSY